MGSGSRWAFKGFVAHHFGDGIGAAFNRHAGKGATRGQQDLVGGGAEWIVNGSRGQYTIAAFFADRIGDIGGIERFVAQIIEYGCALTLVVLIPALRLAATAGWHASSIGAPGDRGNREINSRHEILPDLAGRRPVEGILIQGQIVGDPLIANLDLLGADLGHLRAGAFHQSADTIETHQNIGRGTGCIGEINGAVIAKQLEAVGIPDLNCVARGEGGIGGIGIDEAGATCGVIGSTILEVEDSTIAEPVGEQAAIGSHIAQEVGAGINHELHIAIEAKTELGNTGARGHALVHRDGGDSRGNRSELPARPGGIGIEIEAGGPEGEVAGGFDAALIADIQDTGSGEAEVGGAGELAGDRHGAREAERGGGAGGGGLEIEETLEREAAASWQAEAGGGEDGASQIGERAIDQQGLTGCGGEAGRAGGQPGFLQQAEVASGGRC